MLSARRDGDAPPSNARQNRADIEDVCRFIDNDKQGWAIGPGTENLGRLAVGYPERFGHWILTTNFDSLIEVAIRRSGGSHLKTVLPTDGDFTLTEGIGCHVIRLHGYWFGFRYPSHRSSAESVSTSPKELVGALTAKEGCGRLRRWGLGRCFY